MKKFLLLFVFLLLCGNGGTLFAQETDMPREEYILPSGAAAIPDSSALFQGGGKFFDENGDSGLPDYTGGNDRPGTEQFRNTVTIVSKFLQNAAIPIGIILLSYAGIELFVSQGNEEKYKSKVNQLLAIATGFLLMILTTHLVDWVVFGNEGEILRETDGSGNLIDTAEFARRGVWEIEGLFDMMVTLAVIVMVGYIVYNAFTMILAGGENEQQITNAKKRIIFSITGMVILISIKPLRDLFTAADGRIQVANSYRLIDLIAKWGNYLLGLIAVAAVIGLLYAGVRLIINFGDENAMQNAKKIMIACGIGLLLAFSAWTIVNQFASPVSL